MAILKNNQFGALSGRVGNIVFRQVHGKTVISARPVFTGIPPTPEQIILRNKFKVTAKFSSAVNSNPRLRELWRISFRRSSPYNRIFAANINRVSEAVPTTENIIAPPGGFPVSVNYDKITKIGLTFRLYNFSPYLPDIEIPEHIGIAALHCRMNPVEDVDKPFFTESFYREYPAEKVLKGFNLNLSSGDTYKSVSNKYRSKIIYLVLLLPATQNPGKYIYSETIAVEAVD